MNRRTTSLAAAKAAAEIQRARLSRRLDATLARVTPARLRWDARQEAERRIQQGAQLAVDQVKAHPLAAGAGALAALAWLFREPLLEHGPPALRSLYNRLIADPAFTTGQANMRDDREEPEAEPVAPPEDSDQEET